MTEDEINRVMERHSRHANWLHVIADDMYALQLMLEGAVRLLESIRRDLVWLEGEMQKDGPDN